MNKHMKVIMLQVIFLIVVGIILYSLYPKTTLNLEGNNVNFNSINANVIIISENPDFSNPRYIEIANGEYTEFSLYPGTYYWKASNNYIEGLKQEFTIESEVGMKIDNEEGKNSSLVNIGNVRINVSKGKEGIMVGHIILEPEESEEIQNKENEKYIGRQI